MNKLIDLLGLGQFWTKVKEYFNPTIERIDKKVWKGTQAELEIAIAKGLVDNTTLVCITDVDDTTIYGFATLDDIRALFPQYL